MSCIRKMEGFICTECGKRFTREDSLQRHKLNCKKETKYSCGCGKSYTRKSNLNLHMKKCEQNKPHHGQVAIDEASVAPADPYSMESEEEVVRQVSETENNETVEPDLANKSNIEQQNYQDEFNDSFDDYLSAAEEVDEGVDDWSCEHCNRIINVKDKWRHLKSESHKANALIKQTNDIYKVDSCFGDKIVIYRIINENRQNISLETFLSSKKDSIVSLLSKYVNLHSLINYQMEVTTKFTKPDLEGGTIEAVFYINHKYVDLFVSKKIAEIEQDVEEIFKQLCVNTEEITMKGSNWALSDIIHMDLHINKKSALIGGSYISLPPYIQNKKACINPKKTGDECFKWSVKAYFLNEILKSGFEETVNKLKADQTLHVVTSRYRIQSEYKKMRKRLTDMSQEDEKLVDDTFGVCFDNVTYPTQLESLHDFTASNPEINLNVFGISVEDDKTIVGPLFSSQRRAQHNINLLYLSNESSNHFCWIKDLSRFAARQRKTKRDRQYYCQICLLAFNTEEQLKSHEEVGCLGIVTELPQSGSVLKFEALEKQIKADIVVYGDFECKLVPIEQEQTENSKTTRKHQHVPSSFAYLIKCNFDESLDHLEVYRGANCAQKFVQSLTEKVKDLYVEHIFNKYVPIIMTTEDEDDFQNSSTCHICKKPIKNASEKVRDHNHLNGK